MNKILLFICATLSAMPLGAQSLIDLKTCNTNNFVVKSTKVMSANPDSLPYLKNKNKVVRLDDVPPVDISLGVIKTYDSNWNNTNIDAGYYIVNAADGSMVLQKNNQALADVVAAVKKGETMYCISTDGAGSFFYQPFSTSTWNSSGAKEQIDEQNVTMDFALDESSGQVYGFFYTEDEYSPEFKNFARFNLSTAEASAIRTMEREVYACAADNNGSIYWLSSTQLGSVNEKTGNFNYLFSPKVYPETRNTMTYDPNSGLLYAFVTTEMMQSGKRFYKTSLYSINPINSEVKTIREFDSEQGFAGLFMLPPQIADDAPGVVSNISVTFDPNDVLKGALTCYTPATDYIGNPISDNLTLIIEIDGKEYAVRDVAPNSKIVSPYYTFPQGLQTIKITCANQNHRGEMVEYQLFAGLDVPMQPQNVILEISDNVPHLSWNAVIEGENGGNVGNVKYDIVRYPQNQIVASDLEVNFFDDTLFEANGRPVYYSVVAKNNAGNSQPAFSNKVAMGAKLTVPFNEAFNSQDDFDLWSILNVNGGATWTYDESEKSAIYKYDENRLEGDDWLFSPAFDLVKGNKYKISYSYRARMSGYPESFAVAIGDKQNPDNMTILKEHNDVSNTKIETNSLIFSPQNDGTFYIGLHETSLPYKYILEVDNIAVSQLNSNVPNVVNDFAVIPADNGVLSANISLTAPTTDTDGKSLKDISYIKVMRTDKATPVATLQNPTPGQAVQVKDDDFSADGIYSYYAFASNDAGDGAEVRVSAFVGTDVPDAVNNLKLTEINGKPHISWSAPIIGRNGGWFDKSKLTYTVYRYFGEMQAIAENITANEADDITLQIPNNEQMPVSYVVAPYAGGKVGKAIESNYILIGDPFEAPVKESFPNADMKLYPWMSVTDRPISSAWTIDVAGVNPPANDFNGDSGLATFHSAGENILNVGSWLISPKISINNIDNPQISFAIFHSHIDGVESNETIQLFVAPEDGEYVEVSPIYNRDNGTTGWTRYAIILNNIPEAEWYRFAFKGVTQGGADIYVDDINIEQCRNNDVAINDVIIPSVTAINENMPIQISIINYGNTDINNAEIIIADDKHVEIPKIAAGEKLDISQEYLIKNLGKNSISVVISAQGDELLDNNSVTKVVEGVNPILPTVKNISGEIADNGKLILSWNNADSETAITDNFESYKAWAIDNIGDWIMIDRDWDNTYYISGNGIPGILDSYPYCSDPKAWQIMDAEQLGINIWPEGTPHSGDKMLMAAAAINYVNADWAISPILNGGKQIISLFAKAFTAQDTPAERLRVLYSNGSTNPQDFIPISQEPYIEVPEAWTKYRFVIPEGARRFAIECVSDNAFALFVDDVNFNDTRVPIAKIQKYEVRRNDQLIATVTDNKFEEQQVLPEGEYKYTIRAIFDKGEALDSEPYIYNASAISDTIDDNIIITTDNECANILNASGCTLKIFNTQGIEVINVNINTDNYSISIPKGIYFFNFGQKTESIQIK